MSLNNNLWWCKNCGVPLLKQKCENCGSIGKKICSDLKPMFKEECEFLEKEINKELPGKNWKDRLWMRYKTIWFNGKRLLRFSANGKPTAIKEYFNRDSSPKHCITPKILYQANKSALDELEKEAISFIKEIIKSYPERKPIVSFSGGKDSTVVSSLVRKALETDGILHIFGNTTIEYPDTLNYIKRFFGNNIRIPFQENSSSHTFLEMCKLIEPPSRINAWCCSVFKGTPIATVVNRINGNRGVISFEGIRKSESTRRMNRQRIYFNKKIVHQLSAYPILEWREIDVWLYILSMGLDFNDAYNKGFNRVGCLYCPNNIPYNEYLIKIYCPEQSKKWYNFLVQYAKKIGKNDPQEYVESGAWKMRVGKSIGKSAAYIDKKPCTDGENINNYTLPKSFRSEDFSERFKPFGKIIKIKDPIGYSYLVKDQHKGIPLFIFQGVDGFNRLRISLLVNNGRKRLLSAVERTIRRLQVCILCGACTGICPTGAIKINPHFKIKTNNCIHCGKCSSTKFIKFSCVSLNSQQQSRRFSNVNRV